MNKLITQIPVFTQTVWGCFYDLRFFTHKGYDRFAWDDLDIALDVLVAMMDAEADVVVTAEAVAFGDAATACSACPPYFLQSHSRTYLVDVRRLYLSYVTTFLYLP